MPTGGEGLSGLQEEAAVLDTVEVPDDGGSEDTGPESARETVERVFREAEKQDTRETDAETQGEEDRPTLARGKKQDQKPEQQPAQQEGFKIPPPARLNAAQKEAFNAMPEPLKKAAHAMFREHEAQFTKASQSLRAELQETQAIKEAVRPYLLSHPEMGAQGMTESKFVSSLVSAHQLLSDPKTKAQAWLELGYQVGMPDDLMQALREHVGGTNALQSDITAHPQFRALQEELNSVRSKIEGQEHQRFDATVSSIVSEMEAIRDEVNENGQYLYPELHDQAFVQAAKPLVSALVGAIPGIGYGEALRRAHATLTGRSGNSVQVNQARFPNPNEQQIARAQQAAVSVRGRSAPSAGTGDPGEIPPDALRTPKDSVRWALQQLRRG